MTTQQLADRLVELCRANQYTQARQQLYDQNIESIEADTVPDPYRITQGLGAVLAKGEAFISSVAQWHQVRIGDPVVAANHFALHIYIDITTTDGHRSVTDEIALYSVAEGKIVREQFYY